MYTELGRESKIDGFFPINFIKGPDLVGLQLFWLRIRNSSFDNGSCALIRKTSHTAIRKAS